VLSELLHRLPSKDKCLNEKDIISILQHSSKFRQSYNREWKARNITTLWFLVQDPNERAKAHKLRNCNSTLYYIEVGHLPTRNNIVEDSYIFTHEMEHVIRLYVNSVLIGVREMPLFLLQASNAGFPAALRPSTPALLHVLGSLRLYAKLKACPSLK